MQLALIANRSSGSGRVDIDRVGALLTADGANRLRHIELEALDCEELEGVDRLVVAGGDGSISSAATCALRAGVELAVVPAGTANDFARAYGLPLDADDAARLAAASGGHRRDAEVGRAGEVPFVNAAACGLTVVASERASGLKGALGPVAYGVGAVNAGFRAHTVTAKVLVDDEVLFHGTTWQVIVAASGAFGGGSTLGPVDAQDGRLDVAVIPKGSRHGLVHRAYGMRTGTLHGQEGIVYGRGARVEVQGPRDFNVDGDLVSLDEAQFTVDGVVQVVVPGGATTARPVTRPSGASS